MQNNEMMIVETMFFILDFAMIAFAIMLFVFLMKNEKKRDKYEQAQREREDTILERTDAILFKITQIEWQKAKIQKEVLQHEIRIEKTEEDIKELFRRINK